MEQILRKLVELNIRLLKRLASEDIEMLKEIITLENELKGVKQQTTEQAKWTGPAEEKKVLSAKEPIKTSDLSELDLSKAKKFSTDDLPF